MGYFRLKSNLAKVLRVPYHLPLSNTFLKIWRNAIGIDFHVQRYLSERHNNLPYLALCMYVSRQDWVEVKYAAHEVKKSLRSWSVRYGTARGAPLVRPIPSTSMMLKRADPVFIVGQVPTSIQDAHSFHPAEPYPDQVHDPSANLLGESGALRQCPFSSSAINLRICRHQPP